VIPAIVTGLPFRIIVTGRFGIVTDRFGTVTGRFGDRDRQIGGP
jgi:hypothetical protein